MILLSFVKKLVKWVEQSFLKIPDLIFVMLLCIVVGGFSCSYIQEGHDWGDDYSCYIAQATSILNNTMNEQVDANSFIVTHSYTRLGPGAYPWGYPLLLAGIIQVCGLNYIAMKCLNLIFWLIGIIVFYFFLRKRVKLFYARVGVLLLGLSPVYVSMPNCILSDIPFLTLSILSVIAIDRMYKNEEEQTRWASAVGITCFCTYFIRTNGIVSILTLLFTDFILIVSNCIPKLKGMVSLFGFRKQRIGNHILAYAVFGMLAVATKIIFPSASAGYDFYLKKLSLNSIWSNVVSYFVCFQEFFWLGKALSTILVIAAVILIIYGYIRNFLKEFPIIVYTFGMTVLILLFPAFQGIRYFFSVIPFAIFLGAEALQNICEGEHRHIKNSEKRVLIRNVMLFALLALMVLRLSGHVVKRIVSPSSVNGNAANSEAAMDMYSFIMENTNESDIIAFFKPRALWLNTGRMGYAIESENIDTITDVDYVLIPHGGTDYDLKSAVLEVESMELVYENDGFELYKGLWN